MSKGFLDRAYDLSGGDATRQHYDDWASTYDAELAANDYSLPQRCCEALLSYALDPQAQLLDVGCGTGLAAAAARRAGYRVIDGCDYSAGMLAKARDTGLYRRLFEADLNNPPLDCAEELYDAALIVGVFSFGHVSADALDEILRVLKPGAPVIIGINDKYYREGSVTAKCQALSTREQLEVHREEVGAHLPGIGLGGWVLSLQKRPALADNRP